MIEVNDEVVFVAGVKMKFGKFITKDAFREFLVREAEKNRKYECTETHCPLAEATGYVVDGNAYGIVAFDGDLIGPTKPLPGWAMQFVDDFDHASDYPKLPSAKTAKRALFVLDNAEAMNKYWDDYRFEGR